MRLQLGYVVARVPDALSSFYRDVLGVATKFADPPRWFQFRLENASLAVSAASEAPPGARGTVLVFESDEPDLHQRVLHFGGAFISRRDMGDHGRVSTYVDPEGNFFQVFRRADRHLD